MASWLKVAEDLLEVVDRRAKLVVSELGDEKSEPQAAEASKSEQVHTKKTKKGQLSSSKRNKKVEKTKESSVSNAKTEKANSSLVELQHNDANNTAETGSELLSKNSRDTASLFIQQQQSDKNVNDITNAEEVQLVKDDIGNSIASTSEDIKRTDLKDQSDLSSFTPLAEEKVDTTVATHASDGETKSVPSQDDTSLSVDKDKSQSLIVEGHTNSNNEEDKSETLSENFPGMIKLQEHKTDSLVKVEDQLDEAQGLLKTAVKTGQSKEARLARVCNGLSTRLQEYKAENKQLEELLVAERELNSSYEARIKQFQQELSVCKMEAARAESNMSEALAAKNSEIEALVSSLESLKRHAASSDEKLASLETDMEAIRRGRELTETRVIQALREELASTERRAEEERAAHNATKMAAVEREVELEHRAVEASNALARIQRTADESVSRAAELEHKVALLEVECASLNQELQDLEARSRREQKKPSEEANQLLQVQAWQEEVDRSRQGQRDAENKLSAVNAELQKMRVEMAGMKRDAEHYSRQEHMELEKRYRELTDLLYHKQTQLEVVASEKAALEFQLEKELKRLQEAQLEAERSRNARRASPSWEENADMKTLEPLPLHHRHMVGASRQLQRAAKLLDSGAVRATRFLWRYPTARVILLFYLVFVHLFLMYLLHRLQEQADNLASKEVAASLGLNNSSLP